METRNRPEEIELRRRQNTLIIVGAGTILFGAWEVVKVYGIIFLDKSRIVTRLTELLLQEGEEWSDQFFVILLGAAAGYLLVLLLIRLFIGLCAISEGRGMRRSILYIIVACLLMWDSFTTIISLSADLYNAVVSEGAAAETMGIFENDASLSSIVIELTNLIMLAEMVHASIRVRKLTGRGRKSRKEKLRVTDNAA